MREYRFQATDETVEVLRLLRRAWAGYRTERDAFVVRLVDATEIRIAVDGADLERKFEAFRIRAALATDVAGELTELPSVGGTFREAADFAVGRNDVVLFTGATWIEEPAARDEIGIDPAGPRWPRPGGDQTFQFSGHPLQISESASAVCLTTDAIVIASPVGTGFLVRTGIRP